MLNDLPTELLLNILSFLDSLGPLSSSNRNLSLAVGDYQAGLLRGRISRIRNPDILVKIWTPPAFFCREFRRGPVQPVYVSRPEDLFIVLSDPAMNRRVEGYIENLERKAYVARRVADYLVSLVDFSAIPNYEDRMSFATTLVLHLWSPETRYGHDTDGYIDALREDYVFRDLVSRDRYFLDLSYDLQDWLVVCYDALSRYLRPPFVPRGGSRGEGMWLQRLIARVYLPLVSLLAGIKLTSL